MSNIIYESLIDEGPGRLVVSQIDDGTAVLELFYGDEMIYTEEGIHLMYGAIFGIDVDDIIRFQTIGLREHDSYLENRGQDEPED
jgi:hypothetical protein